MGLTDFLLSLVGALCGGCASEGQHPAEYEPHTPHHGQVITTRPQAPLVTPQYQYQYYHQEQRPKPVSRPQADRYRPYQESRPPRADRPSQRPHQESKPSRVDRPSQRPHQVQESKPLHVDRPSQRPHQEQESKPPHVDHPGQRPHQDQNQINQHDEHYTTLRAKANAEGDLMAQCFQQSHEAYSRGDGALAKQLSQEGKQHERTMESLNAQASAWIFRENNLDSKPGEIDLHGLYVKEAISYADKSIQEARQRGDAEIRFIVGKGLHSDGQVAKLKPAIEDLMKKHNIPTEIDPRNAGVLISQL